MFVRIHFDAASFVSCYAMVEENNVFFFFRNYLGCKERFCKLQECFKFCKYLMQVILTTWLKIVKATEIYEWNS